MPAMLSEWLNILLRWTHLIAAIMWVGDSFLFMWMDSHLEKPSRPRDGDVAGELWMVHSGGFYEMVKRRTLAPGELPENLHWFKWQSYTTWLSGFALLVVVYWIGGHAFLLDNAVSSLSVGQAIALSGGSLVAGWL
ncbi:MAG: urate hydroxylase PuuD, partial [Burkholderiaceae bacterium]